MCGTDDSAAQRVDRSQAAAPQADAHGRARSGPGSLAGQHECREADQRDQRPQRLLDRHQLVAEQRRQEKGQPETDGGADQSEDGPQEAGPRSGNEAEHEEDGHDDIDEIHPGEA